MDYEDAKLLVQTFGRCSRGLNHPPCKWCGMYSYPLRISLPNGDVFCSRRCEAWQEVIENAAQKLQSLLTSAKMPAMLEGQGRDGLMGGPTNEPVVY